MSHQGGHVARCDITELEEQDEWGNMPLGRGVSTTPGDFFPGKNQIDVNSEIAGTGHDNGGGSGNEEEDDEEVAR